MKMYFDTRVQPQSIVRYFVVAVLSVVIIASVGTYFSAPSQYPTADQSVTLDRLNGFLSNFRSIVPLEGSLVSHLVVALPGQSVKRTLDNFYSINDPIVLGIRYTRLLPFSLAQVVVSLGLIAFHCSLIVRLGISKNARLSAFLFSLVVVSNFPMLKAVCKVLKCDALSTCAVQWIHSDFVRCENEEGLKSRLSSRIELRRC